MTEVPKTRTPIGEAELADVLARSHVRVFGTGPTYNRLGLAWSQVMGETGETRSMWNFNMANIMCTPNWPRCHRLQLPASEPPLYRSYESYDDGADDYWQLLKRKYPKALEQADSGSPEGFARELKAGGFYGAPEAAYATGLRWRFGQFQKRFPRGTSALWRALLACCALGGVVAASALWWR